MHKWNQTSAPYPKDITVHQFFEEIVEEIPNSPTLEYEDEKITFAKLNTRSNKLANAIRGAVGA